MFYIIVHAGTGHYWCGVEPDDPRVTPDWYKATRMTYTHRAYYVHKNLPGNDWELCLCIGNASEVQGEKIL